MATTNSITSSTSTTTLSPFDITTNSTTTYLPLNNQLIPPVSSNLILPTSRFYNPTSILQNRDQHNSSSSASSLPLFCELTSNSLLSQQQQLLALIGQQNQSSPISQFYSTTDLTQQNYFNGIQAKAFESLTLANYQKLAANKNVGIKSELTPPTSQINGIEASNIPPTINNLNNNFSTNKQQNLASLEQQLLVLLNLQQQQPQHSQNDCTSNSNNLNVATVINNVFGTRENLIKNSANLQQQQSTQQNSLESFHFKDDKFGQRVGYTVIRRLNLASEDKQVEEHFRKSLGDDRFKQIRNNQRYNQEDDTNAMDDDIDV
uniref:Uncharacterized protein n=1 Tax=Meloidogyne javanica TaxID=6303 RepID=A0A915M4K0_MELJA